MKDSTATHQTSSAKSNANVVKERKYWQQRLENVHLEYYFYHGTQDSSEAENETVKSIYSSTKNTADKVKSLAGSDQAKYLVLMATLGTFMQKYSFQDDVLLFASPFRKGQNTNHTTLLPVRLQKQRGDSFKDVLMRVRQNFIQDTAHGGFIANRGLESLISNYKKEYAVAMSLEGVSDPIMYSSHAFGLNLNFKFEDRIVMEIAYNNAMYDLSFLDDLQRQFFCLLDQLVAAINEPIKFISLIDNEEKNRLLSRAVSSRAKFDVNNSVLELFQRQVKRNPEALAVFSKGAQMTYAELNAKSNQLAHYLLQNHQIEKGDVVGILLDKNIHLMIVTLGILKAGGAYLPLDPKSPKERIKLMVEDAQPKLLITEMYHAMNIDYYTGDLFFADVQLDVLSDSEAPVDIALDADDAAYIIFTSGTSGKPKGVVTPHGAVANLAQYQMNYFQIAQGEHILQFSPFYFDASVEQIWIALCSGSQLFMVDDQTIKNHDDFHVFLKEQKITHLHATPSYLEALNLDEDLSLKRVIAGGEVCQVMTAQKFVPNYTFFNEYGPTETTVTSIECQIEESYLERTTLPIGKPIANTDIYVLDRDLNLVPDGTIGDLYIGGKGVAKGYLNRPELTQERFIENPFNSIETLYKTGDMVRWMPDGNLEFHGRNDSQVKIRGHRIELQEIRHQILQLDAIDQAEVIVKQMSNGQDELVAYTKQNSTIDTTQIQEKIALTLPDYMIPKVFVEVNDFPTTANGKVNVKALPEPFLVKDENHIAPKTQTERLIAEIWAEIIDIEVETIGLHKDFFELGMNSINAFQVTIKLKSSLSKAVKISDVFKHNTIAKLTQFLENTSVVEEIGIPKAAQKELNITSAAQERMYYNYLLEPESLAYNIAGGAEIKGTLDVDELKIALEKLVQRHPSLRTSFVHNIDGIRQKVHEEVAIDFQHIQDTTTDEQAHFKAFVRPHDLSNGKPIRFLLIDRDAERHLLFVDVHHIVCDGYSLGILISDLELLLKQKELPTLNIDYVDYSYWQRGRSEELENQKAFWKEKLSGELQPIELAVMDDAEDKDFTEAHWKSIEIPSDTVHTIHKLISENGLTNFMFFISMYYLLMHKITGSNDIIIGSDVIGRTHTSLKNIVGTFVNILPLRMSVDVQEPFQDFLQKVKICVLEGFANQEFQFDAMLELVENNSSDKQPPLAQIHFAFDDLSGEKDLFEADDLIFTPIDLQREETTQYEFKIEGVELEGRYLIRFISSVHLYDQDTLDLFSSYYQNMLHAVLADPTIKIEDITLI